MLRKTAVLKDVDNKATRASAAKGESPIKMCTAKSANTLINPRPTSVYINNSTSAVRRTVWWKTSPKTAAVDAAWTQSTSKSALRVSAAPDDEAMSAMSPCRIMMTTNSSNDAWLEGISSAWYLKTDGLKTPQANHLCLIGLVGFS